MREEQADHILAVERIVAKILPDTDEVDEEDEIQGYVVDLLVRHFVAQAPEEILHRLLAPPRNEVELTRVVERLPRRAEGK